MGSTDLNQFEDRVGRAWEPCLPYPWLPRGFYGVLSFIFYRRRDDVNHKIIPPVLFSG